MSRLDNLAKLKSKQSLSSMVVFSDGEALGKALNDQFTLFKDILGKGVDINADELLDQLQSIKSLENEVKTLRESIDNIAVPEYPEKVKIDGLESLITYTKSLANKKETKTDKLDLKPLTKLNAQMEKLISNIQKLETPKQGTQPADYVPMRRVMKVGNTLMWDDSFYTGGGGAGGTQELGSDTFATGQVQLNSNTPTLIIAAREGRRGVLITMLGAVDSYLGNATVSTTTGNLLLGTKGTALFVPTQTNIYGISNSSTPSVSYIEVY